MRAPELDAILAALADPTRRRVIDLLRTGPQRASELASAAHSSRPAMSRHLRILREGGLIEDERPPEDARVRLFRLRREPFQALSGWLAQVEGFWTDQLQAFARHAEQEGEGGRP